MQSEKTRSFFFKKGRGGEGKERRGRDFNVFVVEEKELCEDRVIYYVNKKGEGSEASLFRNMLTDHKSRNSCV